SYWKAQLSGAPATLDLPTDHSRPSLQLASAVRRVALLPGQLVGSLKDTCGKNGVSAFMVLLAALKILLFKWTGQTDLVIGTVTANRNRFDTEGLIGCFIEMLPLRSQLEDEQTVQQLLRSVRKTVLEAYSHQECPFGKIVEAVRPDRRLDRSPIYNVGFLLQNFNRKAHLSDSIELSPFSIERQVGSQLDLRFVVIPQESSEGWRLACDYQPELFDEETIEQVLEGYRRILSEVVREGDVRIGRVELPEGLEGRGERGRERRGRETVAVRATVTAEPVEGAMVYWIEQMEMECGIEFAPYNQVFQQLLDKESLLRRNRRGLNVLLVRVEDWHKQGVSGRGGIEEEEAEEEKLRESVKRLGEAI